MEFKPAPVIRASYLNLFMDSSRQCAASPQVCLQQFNLPSSLCDRADAYLPLMSALSFVKWMASGADIEAFMLRVGARLHVSDFDPEVCSALYRAPSLESALQRFCRLADRELSVARYRIVRDGDTLRVQSYFDVAPPPATGYYAEWLRILSLMTVIRHFTGEAWTPDEIALHSHHQPLQRIREAFPLTRFSSGQAQTAISFPVSLFRLATLRSRDLQNQAGSVYGEAASSGPASWDFPTTLGEILKAYLGEGYPDIGFAARIVGCSVRTLQRRLDKFQLSYTDVVQKARFEAATDLLRKPDTKVIEAAHAVGYEDPAHFARAFKRLAGVSPKQYRRANYA
jgi:AraC-like DNA-binding protein